MSIFRKAKLKNEPNENEIEIEIEKNLQSTPGVRSRFAVTHLRFMANIFFSCVLCTYILCTNTKFSRT